MSLWGAAGRSLCGVAIVVAMTAVAPAQSRHEELATMVTQLRKTPDDSQLRERIIKIVLELKPVPDVPEEAERSMARGEIAASLAKDAGGYERAIAEFKTAANVAPWLADAYFNLAIAQEKAGKVGDATGSFRFYTLSALDGKNAADIRKRIFLLEYATERVTTASLRNSEILGKPEMWSAIADWIIAIANIVLFILGFLTLRHDRLRIKKMEENDRRRFAESVYVWIDERTSDGLRVVCRNGGNCAIYSVVVCVVSESGEIGVPKFEIESMKPLEEAGVDISQPEALRMNTGAAIRFKDPAGTEWLRRHDGRLTEVVDPS